jgi:hypothetical protein
MIDEPEQPLSDQTVEDVITDCDGDPRVAIAELLEIIRSLIHGNQSAARGCIAWICASPPHVFGQSK